MYLFYEIELNENRQNLININKIVSTNAHIFNLYKINLENKQKYKKEIEKIINIISKKELINNVIILEITKTDNFLFGIISQLKQSFDLVLGSTQTTKLTRFLLEATQIDGVIDPQNEKIRDSTHNFNSGLNQVLAQIAKEKNKKIFFSTNSFIKREKIDTRIVGKIQQNINILQKKQTNFSFVQIIRQNSNSKIFQKNFFLPFFNI